MWEISNHVKPSGYLELRKQTIATLRFHRVEDFKMEGFNYQNAILGLSIEPNSQTDRDWLKFLVELDPAFGISAKFRCRQVEVVEVIDFDETIASRSQMVEL